MSTIESKANATRGEEREQGRTRQARPASTHDEQRTPSGILQRMAQEDTPFGRLLRSLPPYYGDFGGEPTAHSPQLISHCSPLLPLNRGKVGVSHGSSHTAPPPKQGDRGGLWGTEGVSHGSPLLGIDLWTRLRTDPQPSLGKPYHGRLVMRDTDYALFTEDPPAKPQRRNPRIFDGRYVTLTRREGDGHLRLNFKELPFPPGLDDEAYAHGVGQEVKEALALCHVGREDAGEC